MANDTHTFLSHRKGLLRLVIYALFLTITSCNPRIVSYADYDEKIDIHQFRTYNWEHGAENDSSSAKLDALIRAAVDSEMQDAGFVLSTSHPDLLVHYHAAIDGTFILDMMERSNHDLVWRGWAFSDLDDNRFSSEQLVKRSVTRIFNKFPSMKPDGF